MADPQTFLTHILRIMKQLGSYVLVIVKNYPTLPFLMLLILFFSCVSPYFLSAGNARSILAVSSVVMIAALGETFVLLTGGIDLSVSAIISVSAILSGTAMAHTGNIALGVIVAIAVGVGFGLLNGILIGRLGLTPFIVTLGTQLVARGIAFMVSKGIAVGKMPASLIDFGFLHILGIPAIAWVAVFFVALCVFFASGTTWGRYVYLLGSNTTAARYVGVNTTGMLMSVYICSAVLSSIAGFISIANLGAAIPGVGDTLLLTIIGGVVLGGTSLSGGEGSIMRTVIGIALLAVLTNGLNLIGFPFYDQLIIQGLLIFVGTGMIAKMRKVRR